MNHPPTRPTLGIYGPAPGHRSGVATYIQRSLPHLGEEFACTHASTEPPGAFDRVLYHLGNNAGHHEAFRALRTRPGPILLHEFNNLDYYYQCWTQLSLDEQQDVLSLLAQALDRAFPNRDALERYFLTHPDVDRYSIDAHCERLAVTVATTTFVHSEHTAAVLRQRYPTARIATLPFPVTPITQPRQLVAQTHLGLPNDAYVFATFGFLGEYKRLEQVIEAWQRWTDRPGNAVLVLAGERQYPLRIPHDCPSIRETGYLDDEAFHALILNADCAIQLRFPCLGETSGPISTLIAHSRPVILSDIPEMACYAARPGVTFVPVGPGEVPALVQAMQHHLRHPAGQSDYDPAFSWESWRAAFLKELHK